MDSKNTYGLKKTKAYGLCGVVLAVFLMSAQAQAVSADELNPASSPSVQVLAETSEAETELGFNAASSSENISSEASSTTVTVLETVAETSEVVGQEALEPNAVGASQVGAGVEIIPEVPSSEAVEELEAEEVSVIDNPAASQEAETVTLGQEANNHQETSLSLKRGSDSDASTSLDSLAETNQTEVADEGEVSLARVAKVSAAATGVVEVMEKAVVMHRLYNPNSGEHFYTANVDEKNYLVKVGWRYENIGWYAATKGESVYRLYNPNAGDHHYTLSLAEKNHLVSVGWRYEGVSWHSDGTVAMNRLYNPNARSGSHHHTSSKAESDFLVKHGWCYEGISWYGIDDKKLATPTKDSTQVTAKLNSEGIAIALTSSKIKDLSQVSFSVWSEANGQNDIKWYQADSSGKALANYGKLADYGNYFVQAYLNEKGKLVVLDTTSITIAKPEVKETITKNNDMTYTITISGVPLYISSVSLPVWSDKNGQDDIIWTKTSKVDNSTYRATIRLKDHNYDSGKYQLHVYGQSKLGGNRLVGLKATSGFTVKSTEIKASEPVVTETNYDKNKGTLTVVVSESKTSKAIKSVRIAAWSEKDRGNLYWYSSSAVKEGQVKVTIDEKYHHNLAGDYQIHVYVTTRDGAERGQNLGNYSFNKVASQSKVKTSYKGTGVYDIAVDKVYSNGDVVIAVWSNVNGQDDIKWYRASKSGDVASTIVNVTQHAGTGTYHIHVYQNDNGKMYFLTSQDIQVKRSNFDTPYYSQRDSRWANKQYNYYTMAATGCVPTSLAMVFSSLTGTTVLPVTVADYLYNHTIEFNRAELGTRGAGILMATRQWGLTPTVLGSFEAIADSLKEGHHVVVAVQQNKFSPWGGGTSHELVLKGFSNGNTYVRDPYNAANNGWYPIISLWNEQSTQKGDVNGLGRPFVKITDK